MASKSPAGEAISQVAQAEGGTTKGSTSAQMQSELTKQMNAQQGTQPSVEDTSGPSSSATQTRSAADEAISQVAQAEGGTTKGSKSAQMQSELTKQINAQRELPMPSDDDTSSPSNPTTQSKSAVGEAISQVAHAEGGTSKGSVSAQMQSEVTKQMNAQQGIPSRERSTGAGAPGAPIASTNGGQPASDSARSQLDKEKNFEQAAQEVGSKMQNNPGSVTTEDAAYLESRESKSMGGVRPPSDSIAAEAKRMAAANEQGTTAGNAQAQSTLGRTKPSQVDHEANFQDVVDAIKPKMETAPEQLTKADANLLHGRENRAHGRTEKGGIAAQVQHIVSENEKKAGQGGA